MGFLFLNSYLKFISLQDVSFTVYPGQTVALVGPSGGGKSSIVSLIEHFYECDKGSVLIDGNPVADYDHEYIHQKVIYCFGLNLSSKMKIIQRR